MKSKTTTYILLAAVLGVWGFILMKIFTSMSDSTNFPTTARKTFSDQQVNLSFYSNKKVSSLLLDYTDPMLRNLSASTNAIATEQVIQDAAVYDNYSAAEPYESVPQIDVQYLGYIENMEDKHPTAIVTIQGGQFMMDKGEVQSGVRLISIDKGYIKIKIEDKTKTIYKNEAIISPEQFTNENEPI